MSEKEYADLKDDDIWTTDGIHVLFHALRGPEGIPVESIHPDEADIFVPGYTIPDSFFE